MLGCRLIRSLLAVFLLTGSNAFSESTSQNVSAEFLFERCFGVLTGFALPRDPNQINPSRYDEPSRTLVASLIQSVRAGSLTPAQACLTVLRQAELEDCSGLSGTELSTCQANRLGKLKTDTSLGRAVLKSFHSFFQTFSLDYDLNLALTMDAYNVDNWYDSDSYATTMLYNFFSSSVPFHNIVTGSAPIMRLGADGTANGLGPFFAQPQFYWHRDPNLPVNGAGCSSDSSANNYCLDPRVPWTNAGAVIQSGPTIGARPMNFDPYRWNAHVNIGTSNLGQIFPGFCSQGDVFCAGSSQQFPVEGYYYNRGTGGNLLTNPGFLMASWPAKAFGTVVNNPDNLWRRWSKETLNVLFCKDVQSLRYEDGAALAVPNAQFPPWAQGGCMTCHGTMDEAAALVRGYTYFLGQNRDPNLSPQGVATRPVQVSTLDLSSGQNLVQAMESPGNPATFYQREPWGRLRFRSYTGDLIEILANGPGDLGQKAAIESPVRDLYACATSRVFQFMTNIRVDLVDWDNSIYGQSPTDADRLYRKIVDLLTDQLMNDPQQDLMKVVETILNLPMYQRFNLRALPGDLP